MLINRANNIYVSYIIIIRNNKESKGKTVFIMYNDGLLYNYRVSTQLNFFNKIPWLFGTRVLWL